MLTLEALMLHNLNLYPLGVVSCCATFKWVKITYICTIWIKPYANLVILTLEALNFLNKNLGGQRVFFNLKSS